MSSTTTTTTSTTTITPPKQTKRPPHILLGITGSVASIKGPELALTIAQTLCARVIVVLTHGGTNFWYKSKEYKNGVKWFEYCSFVDGSSSSSSSVSSGSSGTIGSSGSSGNNGGEDSCCNEQSVFSMLESSSQPTDTSFQGEIAICHAQDEWDKWDKIGDPVLHIQLRDWADMLIIAPLSAHTLSKLSYGLCDDTLSCIVRAWDYKSTTRDNSNRGQNNGNDNHGEDKHKYKHKHIIVAPAMNTAMWEHPLTSKQLDIIKSFWSMNNGIDDGANDTDGTADAKKSYTYVVNPQVKTLACGDIGTGAMADVVEIVNVARTCLFSS